MQQRVIHYYYSVRTCFRQITGASSAPPGFFLSRVSLPSLELNTNHVTGAPTCPWIRWLRRPYESSLHLDADPRPGAHVFVRIVARLTQPRGGTNRLSPGGDQQARPRGTNKTIGACATAVTRLVLARIPKPGPRIGSTKACARPAANSRWR